MRNKALQTYVDDGEFFLTKRYIKVYVIYHYLTTPRCAKELTFANGPRLSVDDSELESKRY